MVNEDHKRCSTNHVHGRAFPVASNKFKWVILIQRFAKNSLNVKKEKSYSKFGFLKMERCLCKELRRLTR